MVAVIDRRVQAWQASVVHATKGAISDFGKEEIRETALWNKNGAIFMKALFRMPHKHPLYWGKLHVQGNAADLDNLEKLIMDEIVGRKNSPFPHNDSRIAHKEGLKVWCRPRDAGATILLEDWDEKRALARFLQPLPHDVEKVIDFAREKH